MLSKNYSFSLSISHLKSKSDNHQRVQEIFGVTDTQLNNRLIFKNITFLMHDVTYITGFSGSGKSTLVNLIKKDFPDAVIPTPPAKQDIPIIDLLDLELQESMKILGWVGLGEAYLYLTPYSALSEGQKTRFLLAMALSRNPSIIIVDEFLSNLDRITAKVVAYSFQKICRKQEIHLIVASAHNDLIEALAPDILIDLDLNGTHRITNRPIEKPFVPDISGVQVESGTIKDYEELKRFHYFGDEDLFVDNEFETEIFTIRLKEKCIGVSVMKSPYPKDWEEIDYFKDINDRIRCLVRLIIHPSFRTIGLSKLLMRPKFLDVPYIETRSALGLYMPIYLSGGYSRTELPDNKLSPLRQKLWNNLSFMGLSDVHLLRDDIYCENFVQNLSGKQKEALRYLALNVYVEMMVNNYIYFRSISKMIPLLPKEMDELKEMFLDVSDEIPVTVLLQETSLFKMQGFVVQHKQ
ncbi:MULTISPECIES: hypothetical protein [Bacillus]|uniref:hypothetical protein n=1 Tax=Bacillus TaxID=1386 RepID=UPI0013781691|nr:hypothetical protein [Bacillus subtilis]KAF1340673.1 hypothetical protein ABP1_1310 [Bacillus subtilis]MEC1488763.1 hypothetical protein [Bacillus subtilis]